MYSKTPGIKIYYAFFFVYMLSQRKFNRLSTGYPRLDLLNQLPNLHRHALLLRMPLGQAQFFDLDLARGELVLAEDDSERDARCLGGFELLRQLWFDLVRKLGLYSVSFNVNN